MIINVLKKLKITSILLLILCFNSAGCATYVTNYQSETRRKYIPPEAKAIKKERIFSAPFDKVWESIISFFAYGNIQIKTLEKDSGIVVAEKTLDDADDVIDFVDLGYIENTETRLKVKTENPDLVAMYGSMYGIYRQPYVVSREVTGTYTNKESVKTKILGTYNVFARKVKEGVNVAVNIDFKPLSEVSEYKAYSTGLFEKFLLDNVDSFLAGNGYKNWQTKNISEIKTSTNSKSGLNLEGKNKSELAMLLGGPIEEKEIQEGFIRKYMKPDNKITVVYFNKENLVTGWSNE